MKVFTFAVDAIVDGEVVKYDYVRIIARSQSVAASKISDWASAMVNKDWPDSAASITFDIQGVEDAAEAYIL